MGSAAWSRVGTSGQCALMVACAAALPLACDDQPAEPTDPVPPPAEPTDPVPTTVELVPAAIDFAALNDTMRIVATVRGGGGQQIPDAAVSWTSSDAAVAAVDSSGLVRSAAVGSAAITATAGAATGTAPVEVEQVPVRIRITVDGEEIGAAADSLLAGDSLRVEAEAVDAAGTPVAGASFEWTSSDPVAVAVDSAGIVRARIPGSAELEATVTGADGPLDPPAVLTVVSLRLPARDALAAIHGALAGDDWIDDAGWLTNAPLDEWIGVHVGEEGEVTDLVLPTSNLQGEVPLAVLSLPHLRSLHLGGNAITGALPPELGRMPNLLSIDLPFNHLTGGFPVELTALDSLRWLNLFGNALTGEIPAEIGGMRRLAVLNLCYNLLTGPIPPEIGDLDELQSLVLCGNDVNPEFGNQLTGAIPPEIGRLRNLRMLDLGANQLTGPIPPEIGQLARLDTLLLFSNELTAIPPEIGNLRELDRLVAYGNRLAGGIPPEIGRLTQLRHLNLGWGWASGRNELTGALPPEIGNLTNLEKLDLGGNRLSGPIPPEIGRLRRLTFLELGSNLLSGALPGTVGNLTQVRAFAVCHNELDGPIPPEIGGMSELRELYLCTNGLQGPVPAGVARLKALRRLNLAGNSLTSALPASIIDLVDMQEFYWLNNDGLCLPQGDDFDAWLAGMNSQAGDRCAGGAGGAVAVGDGTGGPDAVRFRVDGVLRNVREDAPMLPRRGPARR